MTRRIDAPPGAPIWIDLATSDMPASQAFYTKLFGWTVETPDEQFGGYTNFMMGDTLIAGSMTKPDDADYPDSWSLYLATADAAATVEKAEAAGAQIIAPSMPVGDLGNMALMVDPTGAFIGAWEPKSHRGFGYIEEPDAPAWFELYTRDFSGALDFYRSVFDWSIDSVSDTPAFRYARYERDGVALCGVMDVNDHFPPEVPAHWGVYFEVADVDAAVALVVELGGQVMGPIDDTPFGRLATCADPTGANFKLMQR